MKVSEAEKLVCPFIDGEALHSISGGFTCLTTGCMAWKSTVSGKKEISRKTEPYDMVPYDIANWVRRMKNDGYVNIGRDGGFRDVYVKYEEANEGFCQRINNE